MEKARAKAIQAYLTRLRRAVKRGDATESTHRRTLQDLVEGLEKGIVCVNEPKGSKAGHPDMKVALGETPLGFIETKDIGLNLDEIAESKQLRRYRKNIPNLILTDYLEFRWYHKDGLMDKARLGALLSGKRIQRIDGGDEQLLTLLDNFLKADVKSIASPKELAARMAVLAQHVRKHIVKAFETETAGGELHAQFEAFRKVLLPDLDTKKFADMYAQTICYGMFTSKCNTAPNIAFARDNAASYLPDTNPFLKKLFGNIMSDRLNSQVRFAIDSIAFLLNHADVAAILRDFGKHTRKEDPVVHFYETFLAEYDSKLRKSRGVYYTPEPVVSYIVRSVDWLLKEKFNKPDGLADPSVIVLDPACGTGTFLYAVIQLIHERVKRKGQYGSWSAYVRDSLLPRIFGFELLMAPYAIAHLKLGLLLRETGYDFSGDERLGIYLTNTLEEAESKFQEGFSRWISKEANEAITIKSEKPIMVVLGNPPYQGHSANRSWVDLELQPGAEYYVPTNDFKNSPAGFVRKTVRGSTSRHTRKAKPRRLCPSLTFIGQLIRSYYAVDGGTLDEKNPKWLQDDYVKFIRWGQWRIERTGEGILAYISNNGYLDNPTFRGMRQQLHRAFTQIQVLDLHGSLKAQERCPDGSKDENVFDIQPGVAIGIFTKHGGPSGSASVSHAESWGLREHKHRWLSSSDIRRTKWTRIAPTAPFYLFAPQDARLRQEYERGWYIRSAMPLNGVGMTTARDHLVIDFEREPLLERMRLFRDSRESNTDLCRALDIPMKKGWNINVAREKMGHERRLAQFLQHITYRPYDNRLIFYHDSVVWRTVRKIMKHMLAGRNLGLTVGRAGQVIGQDDWDIVHATRHMTEFNMFRRGGNCLHPLYLYSTADKKHLFDDTEPTDASGRRPNLAPGFVAAMEQKLGLTFVPEQTKAVSGLFGPEDVFNYIYAVFHSPTYRKRYAEFLKIDFPRVPLTSSKPLFRKLCRLGAELVALHLMESPKMDRLVTKYPKSGNNAVTKVSYSDETRRVLINDDQYFSGIRPEEWEFHIGGYQVLAKWLKDRKKAKRKLSKPDIDHYQRIVVAIRETIRLMSAIDKAIPKWPIE